MKALENSMKTVKQKSHAPGRDPPQAGKKLFGFGCRLRNEALIKLYPFYSKNR